MRKIYFSPDKKVIVHHQDFELTITDDYVCLDMDQTVFADETGQTIDEHRSKIILRYFGVKNILNMKKLIGILLIVALFAAIFVYGAMTKGIVPVLSAFGLTALIVVVVFVAVKLIMSE